jgi:hypothetical protein
MNTMKFTENDIQDKERLEKMIEKEALAIFNSPVASNGRDLDTIKFCVRQGKVAELWLIENEGYEESDKKWHDLKKDGEYTEVKAYTSVWSKEAPFVQKDLRRLRTESWSYSKWYKLFKVENGSYELLDTVQLR